MKRGPVDDAVVLHPRHKAIFDQQQKQKQQQQASASSSTSASSASSSSSSSSSSADAAAAVGGGGGGLCEALLYLPKNAVIGTSALRRTATLAHLHKQQAFEFKNIRGNLHTRYFAMFCCCCWLLIYVFFFFFKCKMNPTS